ncbi:MAG: hypothetical protein ACLRSW_01425 [Christensenellaceae bacterium]
MNIEKALRESAMSCTVTVAVISWSASTKKKRKRSSRGLKRFSNPFHERRFRDGSDLDNIFEAAKKVSGKDGSFKVETHRGDKSIR